MREQLSFYHIINLTAECFKNDVTVVPKNMAHSIEIDMLPVPSQIGRYAKKDKCYSEENRYSKKRKE